MGRLPRNKKAKELAGNPSKRPNNKDHLKLPEGSIKAPLWLDKTGKDLWSKLAPELAEKGLLTVGDCETLATLCQVYADYREAVSILKRDGGFITAGTGAIKAHPAKADRKAALEAFTTLAKEFGLTPKSRSAITLEVEEAVDPLDEFNANGGQ